MIFNSKDNESWITYDKIIIAISMIIQIIKADIYCFGFKAIVSSIKERFNIGKPKSY